MRAQAQRARAALFNVVLTDLRLPGALDEVRVATDKRQTAPSSRNWLNLLLCLNGGGFDSRRLHH